MVEPEKITIVEGPPPTFDTVLDSWVLAMSEGPVLPHAVRCLVRTLNGAALVERCQNAWREGRDVYLEYRSSDGLQDEALILAIRVGEMDDGQVLHLWVRLDRLPEEPEEDDWMDADLSDEDDLDLI